MKIVFLSNFFNHHQKPFSDEIYQLNPNYFFIETMNVPAEQKKMGYEINNTPSYVLNYQKDENKCIQLIDNADVIITGSAPESLILNRKRNKKLIVRYSERPLRHGIEFLKYIPRFLNWHFLNPLGSPIYMLCSSAYTASDYRKFGLFCNKTYKWGYFTAFKEYENIYELISHKKKNTIIWVARFLKLKHPEYVVELANYLRSKEMMFEISMIGSGAEEKKIKELIQKNGLEKYIHLLGVMPPEKVREYMEQNQIFVFTSDQQEGWGAVMNESMNSACAVVADRRIGSVPFLIQDGINGFAYGSKQEFFEQVEHLLNDDLLRTKISTEAYRTIQKIWNPKIAARRFLELAESLIKKGQCDLFESGPCSRA